MANLNFKWGEYKNLAGVTKSAGTVYITTDEKSMYVDVSDTERIRVQGSVLYYNSVEEFTATTTPPYAQDTLYFFRKINSGDNQATNALMAYNGEKWVQINTPKELYTSLVNRIGEIEPLITGLTTNLGTLAETVDGLDGRIGSAEKDITDLKALVGLDEGDGSLSDRLAAVEEQAEKNKDDISSHNDRIGIAESTIGTLTTNLTEINATLQNKVDVDTFNSATNEFVDKLKEKVDLTAFDSYKLEVQQAMDDKADASAVEKALADIGIQLNDKADKSELDNLATRAELNTTKLQLESRINSKVATDDYTAKMALIDNAIKTKADTETVDQIQTNLTNKINADIQAVNALEYKGNINNYNQLPSANVKIGHMYVATSTFIISTNVSAAPGDLFIASGSENDDGVITGAITWNHVKTGYDQLLNPYLKLQDNTIKLYNYANTELGSIELVVADGTNLSFTSTIEDKNQKITLSNTWGTF